VSQEDVVVAGQGRGGEGLIGRQQSRWIMGHKGSREVGDDLAQDLSGAGRGHGHLVGKPSHCVGVDDLVGSPIDAGVALVALKVGTNVPAIDSGWGPSGALAGLLVDDHMCAKRDNGVSVVIIGTIQAGPCGMFGVETRGSK